MSPQELVTYTKGKTSVDLYADAISASASLQRITNERKQFGHTAQAKYMQVRSDEMAIIADALRPQHYEGPNN